MASTGKDDVRREADLAQPLESHVGVLDHVVQPGHGLGVGIASHPSRDSGRVVDVGLAGLVDLPGVNLLGQPARGGHDVVGHDPA